MIKLNLGEKKIKRMVADQSGIPNTQNQTEALLLLAWVKCLINQ